MEKTINTSKNTGARFGDFNAYLVNRGYIVSGWSVAESLGSDQKESSTVRFERMLYRKIRTQESESTIQYAVVFLNHELQPGDCALWDEIITKVDFNPTMEEVDFLIK